MAIEFVLTTARPSLEAKLINRNGNKNFIFMAENIENISWLVKGESKVCQIYVKKGNLVLNGPRRVGKTTAIKWLFKQIESENKVIFDIEILKDRQIFAKTDYNDVINDRSANLPPTSKCLGYKKLRRFPNAFLLSEPEFTEFFKFPFNYNNKRFL